MRIIFANGESLDAPIGVTFPGRRIQEVTITAKDYHNGRIDYNHQQLQSAIMALFNHFKITH
jgi:hypothetical protein